MKLLTVFGALYFSCWCSDCPWGTGKPHEWSPSSYDRMALYKSDYYYYH